MNEVYYVAAALSIFLVCLIIFNSYRNADLLRGFWCADSEFCAKSELDMFILYLNDSTNIGHKRAGYLMAANKHGVILNNNIIIDIDKTNIVTNCLSNCITYNINIDWQDNPPNDINAFPSKCQATYWPSHGKLVFYVNDEIIAILWKDNYLTSLESITLLPDDIAKPTSEVI